MTESDVIAHKLENLCGEFLDGFIIFGYATNGDPVIRSNIQDAKTANALQMQIVQALENNAIIPNKKQP